jgi:hypothetical protein
MNHLDVVLVETRKAAERYNQHQGQAQCCCDRCAHLSYYLAAQVLAAHADAIALCIEVFCGPSSDLRLNAIEILRMTQELVQGQANRAQEAARLHWAEISQNG